MALTDEEKESIKELKNQQALTRRPVAPLLEEILYDPFPVLDHGFVRVVDYLGDDSAVVQAARVSYGKGTTKVRDDRGLIRYLMRHRHSTPFEMCELKLHVKLPIFVARQWIRHRTACLSGDTLVFFEIPGEKGCPQIQRVPIQDIYEAWRSCESPEERSNHPLLSLPIRICNEETGRMETSRITNVWSTGLRPVFQVILENDISIYMTKDHLCFTEEGWMTITESSSVNYSPIGTEAVWDPNGLRLGVDLDALERLESNTQGTYYGTNLFGFGKIKKIIFVGDRITYDLQVEHPAHNFIANGFIIHNSVNEYSGRYSILDQEFYLPEPEHLGVQSTSNRQGRAESVPKEQAAEILQLLKEDAELCYRHYQSFLGEDSEEKDPNRLPLARELARMNLTLNYYTQWYWKVDLQNLLHFLYLRMDPHAQYEIRVYAEAIAKIVEKWVPFCWEAFLDYRKEAEEFSRLEVEAVRAMLRGEQPNLSSIGLSKREQDEFWQKLQLPPR